MTLDGQGQIYAAVGRTGAVHVFAADGRWLRVCVPGTGDVPGELYHPQLTVSDSGDVYLGLDDLGGSRRSLHFAFDGKRVGIEESNLDHISEKWYAQPGTRRRWVLGYQKLYLIDGTGVVLRTIMRRADGCWLEYPKCASVAADGSIAVASGGRGRLDEHVIAVDVYSPLGEPIRTFTMPPTDDWSDPHIAYDGRRVVVVRGRAIVLFDVAGKALGLFTPLQGQGTWWTPFLPRESRGLLLFDGRKTLYRFELP